MRALRGADTPVTLVAVFGNRAVDDALLEMRDTLAPLGFRVTAAAEIIAPHSINTDIAIGRPDASDRARIAAFCAQLASKLAGDAPAGITVPGNKPYCDYNGLPLKPTAGLRCIGCGLCTTKCKFDAIHLKKVRDWHAGSYETMPIKVAEGVVKRAGSIVKKAVRK